jgi:hypothetical protein
VETALEEGYELARPLEESIVEQLNLTFVQLASES